MIKQWGAVLAAFSLSMPAAAQTARPMLEHATAATMRDACIAYAREHSFSVAIAVYDDELRLISYDMMDGTSSGAGEFAHWKAKAAASFRVPSANLARWNLPDAPGMATVPGGVSVFTADGAPLGAIGVSGSTPDADLACAMAGVAAAGLTDKAPQAAKEN